jgi:hypothetical protein
MNGKHPNEQLDPVDRVAAKLLCSSLRETNPVDEYQDEVKVIALAQQHTLQSLITILDEQYGKKRAKWLYNKAKLRAKATGGEKNPIADMQQIFDNRIRRALRESGKACPDFNNKQRRDNER